MAVQGAGAASTFAVGIAIAAWQGPQAQGHYGWVRSAADLLLALALFGFPQGLVQALNRRGASAAALEGLSWRYAALLLVPAALLPLALAAGGAPALHNLGGPLALAALLAGSVGWVLHNLLRAFVLCRAGALQFAWISVAPALTLLAAVAALLAAGSQRHELALLASGTASAALAAWQLCRLRRHPEWRVGDTPRLGALLHDGTHAFAQSAALALQPWLTLWLLQRQGASAAQLGEFVFAAYVLQAFALPTTFVAPLLFARISQAAGAGREVAVGRPLAAVVALAALAALGAAVTLPWAVTAGFGAAYAAAVPACVVLALAGPLVVFNRIGVSVLFGRGRFAAASVHAAVRAAAVPAALWAAWQAAALGPVTGAAVGWLLAEGVCAVVLAVALRRRPPPT